MAKKGNIVLFNADEHPGIRTAGTSRAHRATRNHQSMDEWSLTSSLGDTPAPPYCYYRESIPRESTDFVMTDVGNLFVTQTRKQNTTGVNQHITHDEPMYTSMEYNTRTNYPTSPTEASMREDKSRSCQDIMLGTPTIVFSTLLGVMIGILCKNYDASEVYARWINLPGELFLRALKCLIIPFVFASIASSIVEIVHSGKGARIGIRVGFYFLLTKIFAIATGIMFALIFQSTFDSTARMLQSQAHLPTTNTNSGLESILSTFECPNPSQYATINANNTLQCSPKESFATNELYSFNMSDVNQTFDRTSKKAAPLQIISVSQQLATILKQLFPENIVQTVIDGNLLGVTMFAIIFGAATCVSIDQYAHTHQHVQSPGGVHSRQSFRILPLLHHIVAISSVLIEWLIQFIPFAMVSLIASAIISSSGDESSLQARSLSIAYLILAYTCALLVHGIVTLPCLFFLTTRCNPYNYLKNLYPAQIFAFGCSSSQITLPITIQCVDNARKSSRALTRFVLTMGVPLNKDGSAIYLPLVIMYMFRMKQMIDFSSDSLQLLVLGLVSLVSSLGIAAVPNASLALIWSVWSLISDNASNNVFAFVIAIDWLRDRMSTVMNITGEAMLVPIIAKQVDEINEKNHDDDEISMCS